MDKKRQIILDTDIGCDCDDAAALALLNVYKNQGIIDLLAITQTTSLKCGTQCIYAINQFYGNAEIPIGVLKTEQFLSDESFDHYASKVAKKFIKGEYAEAKDAIKLLRQTLADAENDSIEYIGIGPAKNTALLLLSPADEISPYSGKELFNKKVKEVFFMGGSFGKIAEENHHCEYNVVMDVASFKVLLDDCTKPIFLLDFNTGNEVVLGDVFEGLYETNPVACSYEEFVERPS